MSNFEVLSLKIVVVVVVVLVLVLVLVFFFTRSNCVDEALINFNQLLQQQMHCRQYQVVMAEMLNPLYLTFPVLERLPFPRNLRFRKAVDHMYKVLEGATLRCTNTLCYCIICEHAHRSVLC